MTPTKRTSVLIGIGIGGVFSLAGFGISRIFHQSPPELTRAQALPPPLSSPLLPVDTTPSPPTPLVPSDSLADRYSVDPQELGTLIGSVFSPPSAPPAAP